MRRVIISTGLCACLVAAACGQEATKPPATGQAGKGAWVSVSDAVLAAIPDDGKGKNAFNSGTAGVVADRTNGEAYMIVNNRGVWKSTDQGATFKPCSPEKRNVPPGTITGRCETPFALNMDPNGGRLMCFMIYGSAGRTDDGGKTWTKSKVGHLDFGAVDWEASGKCMVAIVHESGGKLMLTTDAGAEWKELGKGFSGPVGVFDDKTLLAGKKGEGLARSTDGGATWTKVADPGACGQVVYVFKGAAYLATEKGLLVSKDKGATWAVQGEAVKATIGPLFGRDENDMVVVGAAGIHRTTDGGKTWSVVGPLAPEINLKGAGCCYAWDPVNNVSYASQMGKPTFKLGLPPK
jgi:photosystem II stability/assembly factor-like uncharacterized protein